MCINNNEYMKHRNVKDNKEGQPFRQSVSMIVYTMYDCVFKGICNPSLHEYIHLNVFVYKAFQWHSVTEYFIGWLISSFVIKSCIIKESFPFCTQLGLTWYVEAYMHTNYAILDCEVKKHIWINEPVQLFSQKIASKSVEFCSLTDKHTDTLQWKYNPSMIFVECVNKPKRWPPKKYR